jgi:hypothetical protein
LFFSQTHPNHKKRKKKEKKRGILLLLKLPNTFVATIYFLNEKRKTGGKIIIIRKTPKFCVFGTKTLMG